MPMSAASIMTQRVVTVSPEATVAEVAAELARNGISGAPVCDKDGTLLGMISEGDLLHPFAQDNQLLRSWWLSLLAEGGALAPAFFDYIRSDRRCAGDLMSHPVIIASDEAALGEIVGLLQRHHFKRIPIVHDGKLVGIVSRADIISILHRDPDAFRDLSKVSAPIGSRNPSSSSIGSVSKLTTSRS